MKLDLVSVMVGFILSSVLFIYIADLENQKFKRTIKKEIKEDIERLCL